MALLPIFPHMPRHIKENMIKRLDFDQKCSKEFKELVDSSKTSFKRFNVRMKYSWGYKIKITEGMVEYEFKFNFTEQTFKKREPESPNGNGNDDFFVMMRTRMTSHSLERRTAPLDAMFTVIASLFRNVSKMNIEQFGIDFSYRNLFLPPESDDFFDRLQTFLSNSNDNLLSVEQFSTDIYENNLLRVLPCLKPGTLQKLTIKTYRVVEFNFDELQQLPQWQQAVCIKITAELRFVNYDFLSDFKFVALCCEQPSLDQLKSFITRAEERGDEFEHLHITGQNDEIQQYIETNFWSRPDNQGYHYMRHPTLNFCLRFSVGPNGSFLQIRRVSSTTYQPTDPRFPDLR